MGQIEHALLQWLVTSMFIRITYYLLYPVVIPVDSIQDTRLSRY